MICIILSSCIYVKSIRESYTTFRAKAIFMRNKLESLKWCLVLNVWWELEWESREQSFNDWVFSICVHETTYRLQINGLYFAKRSKIRSWEASRAENCTIAEQSYRPLSTALFGEALSAKRDCLIRGCIYRVICQLLSLYPLHLKENEDSTHYRENKEDNFNA